MFWLPCVREKLNASGSISIRMAREKVLIVDDSEDERKGLAELIRAWGYSAKTASDGVEGLERTESWNPGIVVTDLKMPRMNGMELLERIAAQPQHVAVILLTSQGSVDAAVVAMKAGAFDFIEKPVNPTRLRNILQHAARLRAAERELEANRRKLLVFLCHSSADKHLVRDLHDRLKARGLRPWFDEVDLRPGQDWQLEITKAVRSSDVVLVCLSRNSVTKAGFVHKEIRIALDLADEKPDGSIFIIPARLDACDVPDRLRRWQWVDLFEKAGFEHLVSSLIDYQIRQSET